MSHYYQPITFYLYRGDATGSITVPAPRRFYLRWAMWLAAWLWMEATKP